MALLMLTKKEAIIIVDRLSRCMQTFYMPRISRTVATCHEWKGIKPPKGRHWRSDPNVLEQLDNDVLIKWSANGVLRKKYTLMKKTERKSQHIWEYKDAQYPSSPTGKNLHIIRFVIMTSSNPGDLVLDCFYGSGSTLQAAQGLGRNWIGIDKSEEAARVTKKTT